MNDLNLYESMTKTQLIKELKKLHQQAEQLRFAQEEIEYLRNEVEKHHVLLDESSDPIFAFEADGRYRYVNKAFADGVGKSLADITGKKIWDVFSKEEADKRYAVVKWVFENADTRVIEVRVPREDGDHFYITTVKPMIDVDGKVTSVICISKDITDRKRIEEEYIHLSTHDILTSLYNRNFFEVELARLQHSRLFPISILVADMDNLKAINDHDGHSAGDAMLRKLAKTLQESFRAEDIIARIGGDEFAVLLPESNEETAKMALTRLKENLEKEQDELLKVSIGLATGYENEDLLAVMRLADDRMYQEKAEHKKI